MPERDEFVLFIYRKIPTLIYFITYKTIIVISTQTDSILRYYSTLQNTDLDFFLYTKFNVFSLLKYLIASCSLLR